MAKESKSQKKAKWDRWWNKAYNARKNVDWKWFQYDLWTLGHHYAKWDKATQQIVTTAKPDGKPKIVINKVYTTLRAVRNYSLRNRPKAEVTPYNLTPETIEEARKINQWLDYMHDRLQLRTKMRSTMWHALKYSVGYWQVLWDEDAEDGQGEIDIQIIDPYDFYIDPRATKLEDARYVIKAVRRTIEDLREDPMYKKAKWDMIKPDNKQSASTLKARIMQYEKGSEGETNNDKEGTVILKEIWYKEEDKVYVCAMIDKEIVREPELTDLDRLPFFKLASDVEPLSHYGQGWVKNIIPVNRLLNMLESSLAEYNNIINKGKYIADKGAGVRVINNQHGQIIEKKRGFQVEQMAISPLSSMMANQIDAANRYIEDIGALHDASLGRIPTGASSGKAIEALMVGDSNNLAELIENTEEFLEQVFEYMLHLASQKYQFARNVITTRNTGQKDFLSVIGESATNVPEGATVLPDKNMVDVKITSWLAHTAEARREVLKELYSLQLIPQETVLEGYSIGNVADIIAKTKKENEERQAQEVSQAGAIAGAEAEAQQEPQPELPGRRQAIAFVRQIINGVNPPLPEAVGEEFVGYLVEFMQSPEAQQLDPQTQQMIQSYADQATQIMRQVMTNG